MNQQDTDVHTVPSVPVLVDGFRHIEKIAAEVYVLTHFHGGR